MRFWCLLIRFDFEVGLICLVLDVALVLSVRGFVNCCSGLPGFSCRCCSGVLGLALPELIGLSLVAGFVDHCGRYSFVNASGVTLLGLCIVGWR